MDWFKQNKSLAGLLGFAVVAAGGMGFLALTAKGKYDEAYSQYTTKAQELSSLQGQQPFPDDDSVKEMEKVAKAHEAAIEALQKEVAAAEIPPAPITPEKFQDTLRQSIERLVKRTDELGVTIPKEKAAMGFDRYQAAPPSPEAAPRLAQMLGGVELAVHTILDSSVSEITDIRRVPIAEEGGEKAEDKPKDKDKDKDKDKSKEKSRVVKDEFEVDFIGAEPQVRNAINALIASKQAFYIPRSISIANEVDKGPPKVAPANTPTGDASTGKTAPKSEYIVGAERLKVTARLEIAHFLKPATK